jgi:WD40 repeat protein
LGGNSFGEVWVFETASGKQLLTVKGLKDLAESGAFSPDGKTLAVGSFERTISLYDVRAMLNRKK